MKKALLILFGGRAMPNMLTILHEKPDLIVPIISQDVQDEIPLLKKAVSGLFDRSEYEPQWDTSVVVNAFLLEEVEEKCLELIKNVTTQVPLEKTDQS